MGSTMNYKMFDATSIASQVDVVLLATIRCILIVFFLLVTLMSFVFAIVLTAVCLFAAGLHLMLRLVAQRPETRRMFALAGC